MVWPHSFSCFQLSQSPHTAHCMRPAVLKQLRELRACSRSHNTDYLHTLSPLPGFPRGFKSHPKVLPVKAFSGESWLFKKKSTTENRRWKSHLWLLPSSTVTFPTATATPCCVQVWAFSMFTASLRWILTATPQHHKSSFTKRTSYTPPNVNVFKMLL